MKIKIKTGNIHLFVLPWRLNSVTHWAWNYIDFIFSSDVLPVCPYRYSEPSILPWWLCWIGALSASPTAPPSLVECKHWGRRTDLTQLVEGSSRLRVPGLNKNPKCPTFDLRCLRSGCCQERRTRGCCRPRRNHRSTTCPRSHTRCCSPWGPRGLRWDSTCLGHTNQDSNYAPHLLKCRAKQHANAAALTRMHGCWAQRILTVVTSVFWEDKKSEFQSC